MPYAACCWHDDPGRSRNPVPSPTHDRFNRSPPLNKTLIAAALLSSLASLPVAAGHDGRSNFDPNVEDLTPQDEPPMLGIHWS